MAKIRSITIKGYSGYGTGDEAFQDIVQLTADSISYHYQPQIPSELNPVRKWKYQTNSPIYKMRFDAVEAMIPYVLDSAKLENCTDIGGIEFHLIFSDKTEFRETYWVPGERFADCFRLIKSMVPQCEYIPAVLLTEEDVEEDDQEEDDKEEEEEEEESFSEPLAESGEENFG